jgi:hypothetical protein
MNKAYAKLLQKESQSLPISSHFLCQLSNISECLPIEKQDRVYITIIKKFLLTFLLVVYIDNMESNCSACYKFCSCTSHQ